MSNPLWFKQHPQWITLEVRVKPSSKTNAIYFDEAGRFIVSLQAPAQEGQANKMLIRYLAKFLQVKQKDVVIQRGAEGRSKLIRIVALMDEQNRIIDVIRDC